MTFNCVDVDKNVNVLSTFCKSQKRPNEINRLCNKQACLPTWDVCLLLLTCFK